MRRIIKLLLIINLLSLSIQLHEDFLSSLNKSQIQKVDYGIVFGYIYLKVKFPSPSQFLFSILHLGQPLNWIVNEYFINQKTSIRKNIGKDNPLINGKQSKAILYQDNFNFISSVSLIDESRDYGDTIYANMLNFYVVQSMDNIEKSVIGLSSRLNESSMSLVDNLYINQKINKKMFTLLTIKSTSIGKLIFGDIEKYSLLTSLYHKAKCKVIHDDLSFNWSCQLNQINVIANELSLKYSINTVVSFSSIYGDILVPINYFEKLLKFLESNPKYQNKWKVEKEASYIVIYYQCDITPFTFEIVIDNTLFIINTEIDYKKEHCKLLITSKEGNNDWVIGTSFFEDYITTFNYENQEIWFYSKNIFVHLNNKAINILIYRVIIMLLSLSVILLFYLKQKLSTQPSIIL